MTEVYFRSHVVLNLYWIPDNVTTGISWVKKNKKYEKWHCFFIYLLETFDKLVTRSQKTMTYLKQKNKPKILYK